MPCLKKKKDLFSRRLLIDILKAYVLVRFCLQIIHFLLKKWVIDLSLVVRLDGVRQIRKNGSLIYLIALGSHTLITCVLRE